MLPLTIGELKKCVQIAHSIRPITNAGCVQTLLYGPKALGKHGNIAEHTSKAESQHHRLHTWSGVDN